MPKKRRVRSTKTAKKTAKQLPALIPQPDGKGALLSGGVPGNAGGPGRPPSAIRATMREHLDLEVLGKVMDDFRAGKIKALAVAKFLAEYAVGADKEFSKEAIEEKLRAQMNLLRVELTPETFADVNAKLRAIWVNS